MDVMGTEGREGGSRERDREKKKWKGLLPVLMVGEGGRGRGESRGRVMRVVEMCNDVERGRKRG